MKLCHLSFRFHLRFFVVVVVVVVFLVGWLGFFFFFFYFVLFGLGFFVVVVVVGFASVLNSYHAVSCSLCSSLCCGEPSFSRRHSPH